jgi:hypothetical protein
MTPTGAAWLLVAGAVASPTVSGPVAQRLVPGAVAREVAGAADRWTAAPPWAVAGVVGLPSAEVRAALGPPRAVETRTGGLDMWTYVAGTDGGSTRHLVIEVKDGRVVRALPTRTTFVPARWPHKLPGLLLEF